MGTLFVGGLVMTEVLSGKDGQYRESYDGGSDHK